MNGEPLKVGIHPKAIQIELGRKVIVVKDIGDSIDSKKFMIGMKGIICHIRRSRNDTTRNIIGVNFNGFDGGHDCEGHCPRDCGYYIFPENLNFI